MACFAAASDNECSVKPESGGHPTESKDGFAPQTSTNDDRSSRKCQECGRDFLPSRRVDARHPAKFCDALCARRNASRRAAARQHQLYPQSGASNFNFKDSQSRESGYKRAFAQAHPEKAAAHRAVRDAVRNGSLIRPEFCESCLRECSPEAHHDDYTKPLVVDWLCGACHRVADAMRRVRESLVP